MDLLRSCYSTKMRLVKDDPRTVDITWYWCEPGAQPGPYTIFASGNYSEIPDMPWTGPGEVKHAPRAWYDGKNIWGNAGQHVCGTAAQFANGLDHWPTPAEWSWCCCPYVSLPCLCYFPPPPSPKSSSPCVCLSPRHFAEAVPHAYGGLPVELAELPLWISRPCVCLEPSTVAAGVGVSRPVPIAVLQSAPCVCVSPSSRAQLVAPTSGYLVAAGSARAALGVVVSGPCVCVSPSSPALLVAPTSGYAVAGVSAAIAAEVLVSRPCVCVVPGIEETALLGGYYGSSAGSSAAGGGMVPNSCCPIASVVHVLPIPIPTQGASTPFLFDGSRYWVSDVLSSAAFPPLNYQLRMSCAGTGAQGWLLEISCNGGAYQSLGFPIGGSTCSPLFLQWVPLAAACGASSPTSVIVQV